MNPDDQLPLFDERIPAFYPCPGCGTLLHEDQAAIDPLCPTCRNLEEAYT